MSEYKPGDAVTVISRPRPSANNTDGVIVRRCMVDPNQCWVVDIGTGPDLHVYESQITPKK